MKNIFLLFILLLSVQTEELERVIELPRQSNTDNAYKHGEWFKFRMSYSGFLKAGNATLDLKEKKLNGKDVFHVVGKGWTTGAIKWFFKVEDRYESYFDKLSTVPYKFIRKIDEGGHTRDIEINFDQENNEAIVNNKKHNTIDTIKTKPNVQDLVSAFYYLRNNYDTKTIKKYDIIKLNMFFSGENYVFKLKFLGRETIKTKLNGTKVKIKTMKFRPYVQAGRVFKEQESLTVWISDDQNKIPLKIKADLAVGSLRGELVQYKGLKYALPLEYKK